MFAVKTKLAQKLNIPELLMRPAFSVENGRITRINREAGKYFLEEGMPIGPLIAAGQEEYESFQAGVLSLTLCIQGQNVAASVQHTGQGQLFILEQEQQDADHQHGRGENQGFFHCGSSLKGLVHGKAHFRPSIIILPF